MFEEKLKGIVAILYLMGYEKTENDWAFRGWQNLKFTGQFIRFNHEGTMLIVIDRDSLIYIIHKLKTPFDFSTAYDSYIPVTLLYPKEWTEGSPITKKEFIRRYNLYPSPSEDKIQEKPKILLPCYLWINGFDGMVPVDELNVGMPQLP